MEVTKVITKQLTKAVEKDIKDIQKVIKNKIPHKFQIGNYEVKIKEKKRREKDDVK